MRRHCPRCAPVPSRQAIQQVGDGLGTAEQPDRAIVDGCTRPCKLRVTPDRNTALVGQHPVNLHTGTPQLLAQPVPPGFHSLRVGASHDQHALAGPDLGADAQPQRLRIELGRIRARHLDLLRRKPGQKQGTAGSRARRPCYRIDSNLRPLNAGKKWFLLEELLDRVRADEHDRRVAPKKRPGLPHRL